MYESGQNSGFESSVPGVHGPTSRHLQRGMTCVISLSSAKLESSPQQSPPRATMTSSRPAELSPSPSVPGLQFKMPSHRRPSIVSPRMAWLQTTSWYSKAALISQVVGLIIFLIAYASPYWELTAEDKTYSGLWKFCIYSYLCDDFIKHEMFGWFRLVQVLSCIGLVFQMAALVSSILHVVVPSIGKDKRRFVIPAFCCNIFAAMVVVLACVIYGIKQGQDKGSLAWCYYLTVTSSLFMITTSIIQGIEIHRLSIKPPDKRPILQHSCSVDSFSTITPPDIQLQNLQMPPNRQRSSSEVRMRVNSMSSLVESCPRDRQPSFIEYDNGPFSP